jgi:L-lactate permease
MTWPQNYDPLGAWPLSTSVRALPVLTLFAVLVGLRARVWEAALSGMAVAVGLALVITRAWTRCSG